MTDFCKETLLGGGGRKLLSLWLCSLALTACNDDDSIIDRTGGNNLQVEVSANFHSRAPIHGSTLPDNIPIGVTLTAKDGSSYDNQNYNNIPYSATTADGKQTWMPQDKPVTLSVTEGVAMAYWPYNADAADMTAVPVETDTQTDYMYSGNVTGLSNATPKAAFQMKHAMTLIRVNVVRGTYTAEGAVTAVTAASEAFCTSGTMNVSTGALAGLAGAETPFLEEPADVAITTAGRVTEFLVLPDVAVDAASVALGVTVDGRKYNTAIEVSEAFKQGYIYTYNLTLDNTALNVSAVAVTPWEEEISVETPELVAEDDQYIVQVTIDSDNYTYIHNIGNFVGTIDWGDGTVTTHENKTSGISHFYTTAGKYIIICSGKASSLYNVNDNLYKDISKIIKIGGDMGITSMSYAFAYQTKLTEIPAGIFDGLTEVTSFEGTFNSCIGLTNIPIGLFDKCTKVTSFDATFYQTGITEIPEGLFDKCPEVTNFFGAFAESEIINIPNGLFKNNTKADNFRLTFYNCKKLKDIGDNTLLNTLNAQNAVNLSRMFEGCSALEGPIPEGLFDNCPNVTNFSSTFNGCSSLTGTIPEGLFDNNTKVTNFASTFFNCGKITGAIPEGLFDNCPEVTSFDATFQGCSGLTTIPAGLFDNCTEVTTFGHQGGEGGGSGCFFGCTALTEIPEGLFDKNTKVTNFFRVFKNTAITSIPEGLFDKCPEVTNFGETFNLCTGVTKIPTGLFDKCPDVINFCAIFENCHNLTSIPVGLFDNNTKVTDFRQTFRSCSKLTSIPEGLFDKCPEVVDFTGVFWNCTGLTGGIPNTLFDNNRKVTNFNGTFYNIKLGLEESLYTIINVDGEDKKVHLYERSLYPEYFAAPTGKLCYWGDWSFSDVDAITAAGWN